MQRSRLQVQVILAVGILIVGLLVPATQAQPPKTLGRAQVVVDATWLAAKAIGPWLTHTLTLNVGLVVGSFAAALLAGEFKVRRPRERRR